MESRKKQAEQTEFAIITKAKDLVKHTFLMTNERRFPKKYRFTIVNRLHDLTIDIFQHIQEANELDIADPQEYRERRYEQKKALTKCKTVLSDAEVAKAEAWVNNYPREILGWQTSEILFQAYLAALVTAPK